MEGEQLAMEGEQEEGNGLSVSDVPPRVCVLGYGVWE